MVSERASQDRGNALDDGAKELARVAAVVSITLRSNTGVIIATATIVVKRNIAYRWVTLDFRCATESARCEQDTNSCVCGCE